MTKTERQIKFIYWTVTEISKTKNVKKVELSVLISWLFYRRLCLCLETANAECLPGKIFPRLRWLFRFTRFIETK